MREKAFDMIDQQSEEGKKTAGFKGILVFRSMDDPNTGYVLSLWESEESLDAALGGIIKQIQNSMKDMVTEPPNMKRLEAREMAAQMLSIPA